MPKNLYKDFIRKNNRILCLIITLLASHISSSQNETKKWYFGLGAGLDFATSPPTILLNSAMTTTAGFNEGTTSISDPFGNLLFYSDGVTVWNKSHLVMANGNGLYGSVYTTQSALIVKKPGSSSIYFLFTLGVTSLQPTVGLNYSIIDISLAAGMGSVTVKNIPIFAPSTEKLVGIKHCNGTDVWVLSHDYTTNNFRALLVTASGVSTSFVLSPVGTVITNFVSTLGSLKVSPTNKQIGCALDYNGSSSLFELYDFDNSTGTVSNWQAIPINYPKAYSCEFSPDGSKFYGSIDGVDKIYQWDLCAGSHSAIINSEYTVSATFNEALKVSTNGKIYVARFKKNTIGVINNPNLAGSAMNYVDLGQSVFPGTCAYGFPNQILENSLQPFTYAVTPSISCGKASFSLPPSPTITTTACTAVGYSVNSFVWYFGDTASGAANTSTLAQPLHDYTAQGTYTASLVYYYTNSCGGINTDTIKQKVLIGILPINSTNGFDLCAGQSLTLSANGAQSYSWSTGAFTNTIVVSPLTTTSYTLYALDASGCAYTSIQTITSLSVPIISIVGSATICPGFQAHFVASGAFTYSWNTGVTQALLVIVPQSNATYTAYGTTAGCTGQQTINVVLARPPIKIAGSTTVCPGTPTTYTSSGGFTYAWSTGEVTSTVVLSPTVTTTYTVQGMDNKGCTNTASILITVQTYSALTNFLYNTPVCEKSKNLLPIPIEDFNSGGVYFSNGITIDSNSGQIDLSATPAGTYVVNYFLAASGCTESATSDATVIIVPGPQLLITGKTAIAPGESTALNLSGGGTYTWSPSDYLSCVSCTNIIASPLQNTKYCVTSELNACPASTCIEIAVTCESSNDYSLPTAFTPNGDGNNDEFCLRGWSSCMKSFMILIYDQWGEKVFESSDPGFCWDGIYKGRALATNVFVYVLKAQKFNSNEIITKKGNISLLR